LPDGIATPGIQGRYLIPDYFYTVKHVEMQISLEAFVAKRFENESKRVTN